jgi:hypothetical protein
MVLMAENPRGRDRDVETGCGCVLMGFLLVFGCLCLALAAKLLGLT